MKFVIATQEFNYLISKCLNVVSPKAAIPVLSNFLIEAVGGMLKITATDLTVGICCFTDVEVVEEGATTLPAKKLAQLVRELTAPTLEVTTGDNEVTQIVAGSSLFKLHGMGRGEFPELPDLNEAMRITLSQAQLKDLLFRTAFAVSREDNRYVLTGVFLQIEGGRAMVIGTDGKRLARSFFDVDVDPSFKTSLVIPLKAVEEVMKSLTDEGEVSLFLMADKVAFQISGMTLVSKLLVGDYPDIQRVIPSTAGLLVPLHREELMSLLRQVSLFTEEGNQAVRFSFHAGELKLSANAMEVGEGKVSMPANCHGEALEIAFSPSIALDVLRHCKSEVVSFCLTDPYNPGTVVDQEITIYQPEELSSLFVLMPMRLNEV